MAKPTYEELEKAFRESLDHLEYCGYGDSWERSCAEELIKRNGEIIDRLDGVEKHD